MERIQSERKAVEALTNCEHYCSQRIKQQNDYTVRHLVEAGKNNNTYTKSTSYS